MNCFECDAGTIERRQIHVTKEFRGVELVFLATVDVCDNCGLWEIPLEEADNFGAALDKAYRAKADLLSARQIRNARESLGMSQRQFAEYVGVGEASVKRWELGALQDKSSDEVIRLKSDPGYAQRNLEQLCARLGIEPRSGPGRAAVFVETSSPFLRPQPEWMSITDISSERRGGVHWKN